MGKEPEELFVTDFVPEVHLESPEEGIVSETEFKILKGKLEDLGIESEELVPGQYNHLLCPNVLVSFLLLNPPLKWLKLYM